MNYLDILLFIPLVLGAWRGFKKGFIIELFTLLALLVGIYAGIHFSDFMSDILREKLSFTSKYLPAIAFTLTFLAVGAMIYFGGKMFEKAIKLAALGPINKIAGLVFGAVKMLFIMSAILVILESIDEKNDFIPQDLKDSSLLYGPVKATSLNTIPALKYSSLFIKVIQ
ncbi:MAG: membrane protein required for colicin V production [Arenicella sp.]|jgi:membrane protein required for colicin V production